MILQTIANKKVCGGDDGVNTGKAGCLIELSTPENLVRMPKSFRIPKETDFNLSYITGKIQDGTFTPILGAASFEEPSADDSFNTNSSGEKRLNLEGLPEYILWFEEGHEFYRNLAKLKSYKSYSFAIIDDQGNWAMAKDSNGDYKGFTAGHVTPGLRKAKVKGGDSEMKPLTVQFINRLEWDINYDIFLADELEFGVDDIPEVNGVEISFNSIPQDGDTQLDINIKLKSDGNSGVEGMSTAAPLYITIDGVLGGVTGVTEGLNGNYLIDLFAPVVASQVYALATRGLGSVPGIGNIDGMLYRGSLVSETAIA